MKGVRVTYLTIGRLIVVSAFVFISCGDSRPGGETEPTGVVRLSLTNAPADAPCLQITVAGTRTVVDSFPLTPGESTTFVLRGLPLGTVQFSGAAYPTSCGAVTANSVANWISDPTAATLAAGIAVDVALVMHRNGRANVSIDFQDDPDAGTGRTDGAQAADAGAAACSPEAVVATAAEAAAAVQTMLENMTSFCLPGQTGEVAGLNSSLSMCSTAACTDMPNTCTATLASPTFAFDPATLSFTATADIAVSGGAASLSGGILSANCDDLVITAPGTSFSGTLIPTIQSTPNVPSSGNVLYTVSNVVVHISSLGLSGCNVLGPVLTFAGDLVKELIEQNATTLIQGRALVFPCPGPGGVGGTGGTNGTGGANGTGGTGSAPPDGGSS